MELTIRFMESAKFKSSKTRNENLKITDSYINNLHFHLPRETGILPNETHQDRSRKFEIRISQSLSTDYVGR